MKLIFLLAHATLFFRGVDATEGNLSNNPNNDADNIIQTIKQELMQVQSLKEELMQKSQNLKSFSLGKMGALETLEEELQELKEDNTELKKKKKSLSSIINLQTWSVMSFISPKMFEFLILDGGMQQSWK